MKFKRLVAPLVLIVVIFSAFSFSGCNKTQDTTQKTVTITVLDLESNNLFSKNLTTNKATLYDALYECEELELTATKSFAGAYLTAVAIGSVQESAFGPSFVKTSEIVAVGSTFIAIYHDIDNDQVKDLSGFMEDLVLENKTYFASGLGASSLTLYNGSTYILKLSAY